MPHHHESINLNKDFPQIEDITGTVTIHPSFGGLQREARTFTKSNLPNGYIPCKSSVSNNGGIQLGDFFRSMLYEMVRDRQVKHTSGKMCEGYEKMGRGQTRSCHVTYVSI